MKKNKLTEMLKALYKKLLRGVASSVPIFFGEITLAVIRVVLYNYGIDPEEIMPWARAELWTLIRNRRRILCYLRSKTSYLYTTKNTTTKEKTMDDYNAVIDNAIDAHHQKGESERLGKEILWGEKKHGWLALYAAPGTKGAVGKSAAKALCHTAGIPLQKTTRLGFIVNEHPVAVKFAVMGTGRVYVFENIRRDCPVIFCLGISPESNKHAWVLTEKDFVYLDSQHKGNKQEKGDLWVHINPENPPEWLCHQSGEVADAVKLLKDITEH